MSVVLLKPCITQMDIVLCLYYCRGAVYAKGHIPRSVKSHKGKGQVCPRVGHEGSEGE